MTQANTLDDLASYQGNNAIYWFSNGEVLTESIRSEFSNSRFHLCYFSKMEAMQAAMRQTIPVAIIINVSIKDGKFINNDLISKLKCTEANSPPLILISDQAAIEESLAAINLGANRLFSQPIDSKNLIQTIDYLTKPETTSPYKVLIIDDNKTELLVTSKMLENRGMIVVSTSEPLNVLKMLSRFLPDVILMDINMPDCSGIELAQAIRLQDLWAQIPIVFLSIESSLSIQMQALSIGGNDYLVKPVKSDVLIASIEARAKKSRQLIRLNENLSDIIRDHRFLIHTLNHHNLVSETDVKGTITDVNEKFCAVSGYSREELIGKNHRILRSDHQPKSFFDDMWRTISKGGTWKGTICNMTKKGTYYWVDSTIVPFTNDKGKPYKYISVRTDITELKNNQDFFIRSQINADIGSWHWNFLDNEVVWSDCLKKMYGYPAELKEINYEKFINVVHPEDKAFVLNKIEDSIENSTKFDIKHRVVWPDGTVRWVVQRGDVYRNKDGLPLSMSGISQDVTEKVIAENKQVEADNRLALAIEATGVGVWDWNIKSHTLKFSKLYMEMLGYTENELSHTPQTWIKIVHPDDLEVVQTKLVDYLKNLDAHKNPLNIEFRMLCKDESYKWILNRSRVIGYDMNDKPVRMLGIHSDISQQKKTEQRLTDAREEADNANLAKSQFLSNMSHELRTPMNAIMGFSQLLTMEADSSLSDSQLENINEITKAAKHLLLLINEVLDLAKIEAGNIDLSIESVSLGDVLNESLQLIIPLMKKRALKFTLLLNDQEITIEELSHQCCGIRADHTRTKQVLVNLLSNAVKYNSNNGTISVSLHQLQNKMTRISISDTGTGIELKDQEMFFEAFNRLGAEDSDIEGTGIGLVICKNIIDLMDGNIGVTSEVGVGSTFWIELPTDSSIVPQKSSIDVPLLTTSKFIGSSKHTHTVLYIEDNPANLRLVTQLLDRMNHIYMWSAHEPMLGLSLAEEHKPDLILLDINLPGIDGFEVLKRLHNSEKNKDTPIIAISANAMPKDIQKGLAAGFNDYITKPIDILGLQEAINKQLSNKASNKS